MSTATQDQFAIIISHCKSLFQQKTKDYGTSWRILRLPSITDQIFIKARRARSIQEKGKQKVNEDVAGEFVAIINYCIMAIMQSRLADDQRISLLESEVLPLYDQIAQETSQLLGEKNHDYGEAWRDLRISSMTDIILMKLLRVKQIEDNEGLTLVSEVVESSTVRFVRSTTRSALL